MIRQEHDIEKQISSWKLPESGSKEEAWEMLNRKIGSGKKAKGKSVRLVVRLSAVAAALVVALLVLSELGTFSPKIENNSLAKEIVWLPDSSQIRLKANSQLSYNYRKIDGARIINLNGEAFFDVNKGKTFKVNFPGGELQVLGTRFNVLAYTEKSGRIDCYEGAVKLLVHGESVILGKGKSLTFDENSIDGPFDFNAENKLNLEDGVYDFVNRPLKEIFMLICQREQMQLAAPDQILSQRFTGTLNLDKKEQAVRILSAAMHFNYQIANNKLMIFEKE